jgi:voltage-gated sodium channel
VLNVLIGIVLNAMDEARTEDQTQRRQVAELNELASKAELLESSNSATQLEIQQIRDRINEISAQASSPRKK